MPFFEAFFYYILAGWALGTLYCFARGQPRDQILSNALWALLVWPAVVVIWLIREVYPRHPRACWRTITWTAVTIAVLRVFHLIQF